VAPVSTHRSICAVHSVPSVLTLSLVQSVSSDRLSTSLPVGGFVPNTASFPRRCVPFFCLPLLVLTASFKLCSPTTLALSRQNHPFSNPWSFNRSFLSGCSIPSGPSPADAFLVLMVFFLRILASSPNHQSQKMAVTMNDLPKSTSPPKSPTPYRLRC